jgi:hypothetical protein
MAMTRSLIAATAFCFAGCTTAASGVVVREAAPDATDKASALSRFGTTCRSNGTEIEGPRFDGAAPSVERSPRVLMELAFLSVPAEVRRAELPAQLDIWAADPAVQLLGTTNRSVALSERSEIVIEERMGPLLRPVVHGLSVDAKSTADGRLAFDLAVTLQAPSPEPGGMTRLQRRISFVTAARERELIVLSAPLPDTPGHEILVLLVPYLVRDDRDLRAIFMCTMENELRAMKRQRPLAEDPGY